MSGQQESGPKPSEGIASSLPETSPITVDRRTVLKGIAVAGIAALNPEVTHAADVEDIRTDLITNFGELSANGDRESMRKAVAHNIEIWRGAKSEDILAIGEKAKTVIEVQQGSSIMAPLILNNDEPPPFFIAKSSDPSKFFPNLGNTESISRQENSGTTGYQAEVQGIYLGRTDHTLESSNAGEVTINIGYFGMYFGDPANGEKITKAVVPIIINWSKPDGTAPNFSLSVRGVDAPNYVYGTNDRVGKLDASNEVLEAFDTNVGNSVVQVQIGKMDYTPGGDLVSKASGRGFPIELFEDSSINSMHETTRKLHETIQNLTLERATLDGDYSLQFYMGEPTPISSPVPTQFPDIPQDVTANKERIKDILKELPRYKSVIEDDKITTDALVNIPRAMAATISPTSNVLGTV